MLDYYPPTGANDECNFSANVGVSAYGRDHYCSLSCPHCHRSCVRLLYVLNKASKLKD